MARLLTELVDRANEDPAAHVVVLQGAGRTFCAGRDSGRGYLQVTGRIKDMIIRGGENIVTELHDLCRTHLAPHKTPARWFGVTELPLTGSGKIQKFRLREQINRAELKDLTAG